MISIRTILASLFIIACLVACGKKVNEVTIETNMTEKAVVDLLGKPDYTQTQTLGELTVIHNEWTDQTGKLSVQFHNGKAQYSQFIAPQNQD